MPSTEDAGWPKLPQPAKTFSAPTPGGHTLGELVKAPPSRNSLSLQPTGSLYVPFRALFLVAYVVLRSPAIAFLQFIL
jgi:hypothetical protein